MICCISVFQLPPVILSHCASGLYQITATKVTGRWCRHSNQMGHSLGWCLGPTIQWEALMVRFTEEKLNECFRTLMPFYASAPMSVTFMFSVCPSLSVRPILVIVISQESLEGISLHLGLKDKLIRIGGQKHVFGCSSRIHTLIITTFC